MTVQQVKINEVYNHDKYGEVLVTGIGKMYEEWFVGDGAGLKVDETDNEDVLVYFYDEYDGYGGMSPTPMSQVVNEFAQAVSFVGSHESTYE